MSDYKLPFHIQEEIMKRLPVKTLIQFRSVSKAWKSLIDTSQFIAAYSLRCHTQPQHLLVSYEDPMYKKNYVCYIDDDTFPQERSIPTIPLSVKQLIFPRVVGSSHGLLCIYGCNLSLKTKMVVLWNPSIRKSIVIEVPNGPYVGFGVCPVTSDPKIVVVTQSWDDPSINTSYRCEVMVYTLSSGKWRTISNNLPAPLRDWNPVVVTDQFIYSHAESWPCYMILSFDLTNEKFEVINLPHSLACLDLGLLYIFKIRESLAMLQCKGDICTVWMMEHGVQRLFTKLFTIKRRYNFIVGFRKNGIPIIQVRDDDDYDYDDNDDDDDYDDDGGEQPKLVVYEANSEHNIILEDPGSICFFNVQSYMETLLLLGRSDCIGY